MNHYTDQDFFSGTEKEGVNINEVFYKYLKHWKWFLLSISITLMYAFISIKYQTPLYKIRSNIFIKSEQKNMSKADISSQFDIFSTNNKVVDNEIEILRSYSLMERVVKDLKLNISYGIKKRFRTIEIYDKSPIQIHLIEISDLTYKVPLELKFSNYQTINLNGLDYPLNEQISTPFGIFKITLTKYATEFGGFSVNIRSVDSEVENILSSLEIVATSKTSSVVALSLLNAVPQKGKDILNNLVNYYNEVSLTDKNDVATKSLNFIEERLRLLSGEISMVEKNIENYKSKEKITDVSAEAMSLLESIKTNEAQLTQSKMKQSALVGIEEYWKNKGNKPGKVPAVAGIEDQQLSNLIKSLSDLELQKESQARFVKSENPILLTIDDQIKTLNTNINENIQSLKLNFNLTIQQLENQNKSLEGMIKTIPNKERALIDISREQIIKNNLFSFLLQKREEMALSIASPESGSRAIDLARSSQFPVSPVKTNLYIIYALLGLVIPFGVIYSINLFNDRVLKRKDIEKATNLQVLAELYWTEHENKFVIINKGRSVFAEQIRALRTSLTFIKTEKEIQSILFTSSIRGEGKSFISLNLGASLAMAGKKTIILEFDLRNPQLASSLHLDEKVGMSSYLSGQTELNEIIRPVPGQENLYIITCGQVPYNPTELLLNGRFEILLTQLKKDFDKIIIDSSPIGIVNDAQLLEQQADITLFVVRYNYTPMENLKTINLIHKEGKLKNLNIIFNSIKINGNYGHMNYIDKVGGNSSLLSTLHKIRQKFR